MTETLKIEDVHNPQLQAIIDAPLPPVRRARLRHEPRKVWAKEVRALFKALGLTGISVTTPSYSMAHSIEITLPKSDPEPIVTDEDGYPALHPAYGAQLNAARDRAQEIILTAFPDLDDRSDSISGYYDFCLAIR